MTISPELRPRFSLSGWHLPPTHWGTLYAVSEILKRCGQPDQAREFRQRALELNQNDDDLTDLLALVSEYVSVE